MKEHIVQSKAWGEFKSEMGTIAIEAGGVQFTKHKVPVINKYLAYCPKVNPFKISFLELKESLKMNNCFAIRFDVPNITIDSDKSTAANGIFTQNACKKASKNTFTKHNILLDLTTPEDTLLEQMHSKHRYNIKYAQKSGVTSRLAKSDNDFETFFRLLNQTANRQKYLIHPKEYYLKIWKLLHTKRMCEIVITEYKKEPLAAWMLFFHQGVMYYPYGGSSESYKNLQGSTLAGWEAIKLGKSYNCQTFDMWGANRDPKDTKDPESGFTTFKLRFGGAHVTYIDSYDLIVDPIYFNLFDFAYPKIMKIIKKFKS